MSIFGTIGKKLRNADINRIGQKLKSGSQTIAKKAVSTLAKGVDVGEKVLPVAKGVADALGYGAIADPLFNKAKQGLDRMKLMHSKATGVQKALGGL